MNRSVTLHQVANIAGLLLLSLILTTAFADQILNHDLPCPLCLLQRISFIGIGIIMIMNLKLGIKPSHYGLMILQALLGLGIAVRQIYIHLGQTDTGYGNMILGLYMYQWSAVCFTLMLILIAIGLLLDAAFTVPIQNNNAWLLGLFIYFLLITLANAMNAFLLCGPYKCPGSPTSYYFFNL